MQRFYARPARADFPRAGAPWSCCRASGLRASGQRAVLASSAVDAEAFASPAAASGDGGLVRRLKAGDEEAYATLVGLHGGRLLAVARRFFPETEDARDAVQEAFLSAFRAVGSFEENARLSTWLHRIVVNACLMKLRSRRRKPEEPIEPLLPAFDELGHRTAPVAPWPDLHGELERKQAAARVRELIHRLPESYRTVLLLRDIEELGTAQAAEALGISENAVKIRLHRARQALRTLLDPEIRKGDA
ncbi:MAG: sigma-70 family RNA polymerase sigma factor [Acidobacteria bacterium]|nr:MAG: sigma-70 family RNA polymerase sigma factor [Acidobacteriota bacterium]